MASRAIGIASPVIARSSCDEAIQFLLGALDCLCARQDGFEIALENTRKSLRNSLRTQISSRHAVRAVKDRGIMSDVKKSKESPKTAPVEAKSVEAKSVETKSVEAKSVETKSVEAKAEAPATENKPDAASKKQGMGEGQKPVSKAYKDNWNDIFGKKKKR
jgi:hypothetical protein